MFGYSFDPKRRKKILIAPTSGIRGLRKTFQLRIGQVAPRSSTSFFGRPAWQENCISSPTTWPMAASGLFPVRLRSRRHPHHRRHRRDRGAHRSQRPLARRSRKSRSSTTRIPWASCGKCFSGYLGFSHYDASKTMGLAAYGDPAVFREKVSIDLSLREREISGSPRAFSA